MLIPIRCFTCGNVLADKELAYHALLRDAYKTTNAMPFMDAENIGELLAKTSEDEMKSPQGKVLDTLGVWKMCCRRHMLTTVDVLEDI